MGLTGKLATAVVFRGLVKSHYYGLEQFRTAVRKKNVQNRGELEFKGIVSTLGTATARGGGEG